MSGKISSHPEFLSIRCSSEGGEMDAALEKMVVVTSPLFDSQKSKGSTFRYRDKFISDIYNSHFPFELSYLPEKLLMFHVFHICSESLHPCIHSYVMVR